MEEDRKTEKELSENYVVLAEANKNWYQILAIIILILYVLFIFLIASEKNVEIDFITILLYLLPGAILFTFMYGIGKIIQLLTEINENLKKPDIKKHKKKNNIKNNDLHWELQEDDN